MIRDNPARPTDSSITRSDNESSAKTLASFLSPSKEQFWLHLYIQTCKEFTYPKCPQLQTSQALVNNANRKRALNEGSSQSEILPKANKASKKSRRNISQSEVETTAITTPPPTQLKNQQIENIWAKAESFAIFDDQDVNSESSDSSVVDSEWM